jgi:NAD(P)-dependent dehydrogenase (short-subunit alcohol dehydrogenase family)
MVNKRIALVTGANRGIGLEVCRQLAEQGDFVILTSRNEAKGRQALQDLGFGQSQMVYHQLAVDEQGSVDQITAWVKDTYGRLDVLINNAGVNYDTWHNALNADLEECHYTMEVNLFGAWRLCQAFMPLMEAHNYGRIVNVSSGSGAINGMGGGTPAYSISKAALNVLTIKLAAQTKAKDVLVNSVCPDWVRTDMGGSHAPKSVEEGASSVVWGANLPKGGPSGGFFRHGKPIRW